jgi:hypothetical protein
VIALSEHDEHVLDRLAGDSKRHFSRNERDAIFNLNKGKCFHCRREMTRDNSSKGDKGAWEVEHLKSVSECGGVADNRRGNLAVSCVACNRGDKKTNTAGHFDTPLSQFDKGHGFASHCQALNTTTGQRCDRSFKPDGRQKYCWQHSTGGGSGGHGHHATTPRPAAQTGLKNDGTPDMRTTLGRALAAAQPRAHTPPRPVHTAPSLSSPGYKTPSQQLSGMYRTSHGSGLGALGGGGGALGGGSSGFVGSATRSWNGNTSGPMTAAGRPDMRCKANWA